MEKLYTTLSELIINVLTNKIPNIQLSKIDYENDSIFIEKIFLNDKVNDYKNFTEEDWIESMKYVYLSMFSFFNNKKGTLHYVYTLANDDDKINLLMMYKKLVKKLDINKIIDKLLYASKKHINASENAYSTFKDLLNDIKNYKDPEFMAKILDLILYDSETRKILMEILQEYIGINFDLEEDNDEYYFDKTIDLIKFLMNIQFGTIKSTKDIKDYISNYISNLIDKSYFINKCIMHFKLDVMVNFSCCKIKKCNTLLECDSMDTKCIKYIERNDYGPLHIKLHIVHALLKILNILVYTHKNDIYNKYKSSFNNNQYEVPEEFKKLNNILIPNKNSNVNIFDIIQNLIINKSNINKIFQDNKHKIKDTLVNFINSSEVSENIKQLGFSIIDEILEVIDIEKIPDITESDISNIKSKIESLQPLISKTIQKYKTIRK